MKKIFDYYSCCDGLLYGYDCGCRGKCDEVLLMKLIRSLLLIFVLVFALSSCGNAATSDNGGTIQGSLSDTSVVTASDTHENINGPADGSSELSAKHYPAYYSVPDKLFELVSRYNGEAHAEKFKNMYIGTEQYNTGAFCEYFGIDIYTYVALFEGDRRAANLEYLSSSELLRKRAELEPSDYLSMLSEHSVYFYSEFFTYYYSSRVFADNSSEHEHGDECIIPESCPHTSYYHMIDSYLIESVGYDEYLNFKNKYGNTEEYNVISFIEKYEIDKAKFDDIYEGVLPTYNPEYLYADEQSRNEYFTKTGSDISFGYEDVPAYKYNNAYGMTDIALLKQLIPDTSYELLRQKYGKTALPLGLIFEYYGITEQQYKAVCEASDVYKKNKESIDKLRAQIAVGNVDTELLHRLSPYIWELHFGEYADGPAFYNEYYDAERYADMYLPPENTEYVSLYHRIDARLLDYVGVVQCLEFAEKFGGTDKFNIRAFLEYFEISRADYLNIILEYCLESDIRINETVTPYPVDALYGTLEECEEFFKIKQ